MKDELSLAKSKLAKQKSEIARMTQERGAHLAHILRLRRMLRNALDNAPGWQQEFEKEVNNKV